MARGVAETVIIARGAEGSVLADGTGRLFAPAPQVKVISAVGAGDTFVGAHVLALSRGAVREAALAMAVAAAAAACITPRPNSAAPRMSRAFCPRPHRRHCPMAEALFLLLHGEDLHCSGVRVSDHATTSSI
ncbi:PfkB family carbohydrate kinase [Gemmobacter lanyuensis]